ncbi:hypothetical protein K470DRAFT_254068 [Piedraia hortae CBS 480.64]|uniref:Uncharacterized protein n=1 Tax=Piedraia hortae CBS 480.64 TaxID=1314780 RepID=A0A6A7CB47_9PEZI|nr:hypothetical protein K470DRAFT_254068 [Piedraia hortae CBS 480.64]
MTAGRSHVSLSGLLNAIDGVASHEGRVLIMTTNYPDRLDTALTRPGRVDLTIKFTHANHDQIKNLFIGMYTHPLPKLSTAAKDTSPGGVDDVDVSVLAENFADIIPEESFTPAEIQSLLMMYKGEPVKAVEVAPGWVESKKKGGNKNKKR